LKESLVDDLTQLEAVVAALPAADKRELVRFLVARLRSEGVDTDDLWAANHSALEIKPVSLGRVIRPLNSDDDRLGEMLEGHR
jgi:hypothetical protein